MKNFDLNRIENLCMRKLNLKYFLRQLSRALSRYGKHFSNANVMCVCVCVVNVNDFGFVYCPLYFNTVHSAISIVHFTIFFAFNIIIYYKSALLKYS